MTNRPTLAAQAPTTTVGALPGPVNSDDLDTVIPATPAAVHEALRNTMPDRYTPEVADRIAADIVSQLQGLRPTAPTGGAR